jgi:hypothetical protein
LRGYDFDGAISDCHEIAAKFPEFPQAHVFLAAAYEGKGMHAQSINERKIFQQLTGDPQSKELLAAYEEGSRNGGFKAGAQKVVDLLQQQAKKTYVSPVEIAGLYALLGDKNQAFAWLNKSYQGGHEVALMAFRTDYRFDSLKGDPRYAELERKIGLPPLR